VALFLAAAVGALAQGTAFTYQGRLNVSGSPANASYDFQFALYDAATAVLEIEFPGGDVYQYLAVPREDYDGLLQAASKGRFFHSNIRGRFAYRRI
jgi:hypothetical protein